MSHSVVKAELLCSKLPLQKAHHKVNTTGKSPRVNHTEKTDRKRGEVSACCVALRGHPWCKEKSDCVFQLIPREFFWKYTKLALLTSSHCLKLRMKRNISQKDHFELSVL